MYILENVKQCFDVYSSELSSFSNVCVAHSFSDVNALTHRRQHQGQSWPAHVLVLQWSCMDLCQGNIQWNHSSKVKFWFLLKGGTCGAILLIMELAPSLEESVWSNCRKSRMSRISTG